MIRVTALAVLLTFAGTPAATAACLVWCGAPCPPAHSKQRPTISTGQDSCDKLFVTAPSLREDSRRADQRPLTLALSGADRTPSLHLEQGGSALVISREHAPPGHPKPPTVLRL